MKIYLGADHRGLSMKNKLGQTLRSLNYEIVDMGAQSGNPEDDFVDFAKLVGEQVAADAQARGILFCGSGVGMCIAANKLTGIRCAVSHSIDEVRAARHDDNVNVLSLASDFLTFDQAVSLAEAFLQTDFAQEERYIRRLAKIGELERNG